MSSTIIYQSGSRENIVVPLGGSIAVFTRDTATVKRRLEFPNFPDSEETLGELNNELATFGPYAEGAVISIEGGASETYFSVGTAPYVREASYLESTPTTKTAAGTLTPADLFGGTIDVDQSTGGTISLVLPTGAVMDAATPMNIGETVYWQVVNRSGGAANVVSIDDAASGNGVFGVRVVQSADATTGGVYGSSASFKTVKTDFGTFRTYRI